MVEIIAHGFSIGTQSGGISTRMQSRDSFVPSSSAGTQSGVTFSMGT